MTDEGACSCGLTFEVRRDRQRDAWPGRKADKPHLQAGPSGLLLGLASTEGLGLTALAIRIEPRTRAPAQ